MAESDPMLISALYVLLMTLLLGIGRALRGPTLEDRMLSVHSFSEAAASPCCCCWPT